VRMATQRERGGRWEVKEKEERERDRER